MFDLHLGDCRDVMASLPANSVDTIITDPPYGLEFMGKDWDKLGAVTLTDPSTVGGFQDGNGGNPFSRSRVRFGEKAESMQEWHRAWAAEALRVAKPGAMLLAFGGTRTFHRLTCAIEDAGWEIRDCLMWLYGSGFPKSHNLAVGIDKAAGALKARGVGFTTAGYTPSAKVPGGARGAHVAITEQAREWEGWGTALKPAWEPIILAMKPLDGTFAQNAQKWGVAGLNIDGGRIATTPDDPNLRPNSSRKPNGVNLIDDSGIYGKWQAQAAHGVGSEWGTAGRWPANLLLDEEAAAMLDEQSGTLTSGKPLNQTIVDQGKRNTYGNFTGYEYGHTGFGDTGGASRFFFVHKGDAPLRFKYVAKASRREREQGLEGLPDRSKANQYGNGLNSATKLVTPAQQEAGTVDRGTARNHHPTVKPIALMEYLCRLTATPTGGVVLDPFMGSGSTGIAALKTGRSFIGIEQNEEYLDIARRRLDWWARQLRDNDKPLPLWAGDIADNEPEAGGER